MTVTISYNHVSSSKCVFQFASDKITGKLNKYDLKKKQRLLKIGTNIIYIYSLPQFSVNSGLAEIYIYIYIYIIYIHIYLICMCVRTQQFTKNWDNVYITYIFIALIFSKLWFS